MVFLCNHVLFSLYYIFSIVKSYLLSNVDKPYLFISNTTHHISNIYTLLKNEDLFNLHTLIIKVTSVQSSLKSFLACGPGGKKLIYVYSNASK